MGFAETSGTESPHVNPTANKLKHMVNTRLHFVIFPYPKKLNIQRNVVPTTTGN